MLNWLRILKIVSNKMCSVNGTWEKILDIVKLFRVKDKKKNWTLFIFQTEESDIKRFVIITSVPFTETIHEYNFLIILNRVPIENTRTYSW